ncbi:MAG TPA: hypothetical protein VFP50_09190 [Anaeromyxobacteraceae bacterium]|nr:hypothetical protein [Anaeromyxobacteraceae bacterium]
MPSPRLSSPALLVAALLAALPAAARAKAWQGVDPGRSTGEQVTAKFGEPTSKVKRGPRTVLAYKGDQALSGTREAQFHLRADGVVEEVTVFLATKLDADSIEGTYGKPPVKTFTDSFQKVWQYPQKGVTVYFDKEGNVEAIAFSAGSAAKAAPAAAAAHQEAAEP